MTVTRASVWAAWLRSLNPCWAFSLTIEVTVAFGSCTVSGSVALPPKEVL